MLHLPNGGILAPEWSDLADRIVRGDGLAWPGDPRLDLRLGVIEYRGRTGRRLEVWRANEDGSETILAHWRPDEAHRVCHDLALMRADRPGFAGDTAAGRIDRHNDALARKARDEIDGLHAELTEYAARLYADTHGPRQKFFMSSSARGGGARA